MAKILIVTICFALCTFITSSKLDAIEFVENIEDFVKANPGIELIPLQKQEPRLLARGPQAPIRYSMGARNGRDHVVVQGSNQYYYPTFQDVNLQLTYPQTGIGNILTFIEIFVEQTSNIGRSYVISGGIGQRQVRLVIEAKQTSYFRYTATFYGY